MATVRRAVLLLAVCLLLTGAVWAQEAPVVLDTPAAFYEVLENQMIARVESFAIEYDGEISDIVEDPDALSIGKILRDLSAQSDDSTGSGSDYCTLNVYEGSISLWNNTLFFTFDYLTTAEEEAWLDREVTRLVKALDLEGESDYTKTKLIYEFIGTNYIYDGGLTIYSAYEGLQKGTMVCQGYSLLLYKMLWEAGVPCRIVTGESMGENHAWNVVLLDGSWYNLDVTWDAAKVAGEAMTWDYFLKNMEDFVGHTRFDAYDHIEFRMRCPMAPVSYECRRVELKTDGSPVGALTIRKGVSVLLEPSVPGLFHRSYTFRSTHPEFVSVDEAGNLLSIRPGYTTVVVADKADRGILPAMLPVTGVDLTTCSAWADAELNSFYLRGFLPTDMTEKFQSAITRGEFTWILYQMLARSTGIPAMDISSDFVDLSDSEYGLTALVAYGMGFFEGTSMDTFSPDAFLTREQAAKVLVNVAAWFAGTELTGGTMPDYADADAISDWAAQYVATASELGILRGTDRGFEPQGVMTREEVIVALERLYVAFTQTAEEAA